MTDSNCLFCKIISGGIPSYKVYEDEQTYVFLDIGPVSKGHYLVVPKNHAVDLQSGTADDACYCLRTVHKTASVVMDALGATGYNLGLNHGVDAGQEVFHTHFHIMPRYAGELRGFTKLSPADHELAEVQQLIEAKMKEAGLWN
jgi:histidine triad (HIT) family protein